MCYVDGLQSGSNSGVEGHYSVAVTGPDGQQIISDTAALTVEAPIAPGTVVEWGSEWDPRRIIPEEIQERVVAIATSGAASSAVLNDGTVAAWFPQEKPRYRPPVGLSRVNALSIDGYQAVVQNIDGTVEAWGLLFPGDLIIPPVAQTGVEAVSAGGVSTAVLKANGTVWRWRLDEPPELLPVSQVQAFADGPNHLVVLKHDGTVAQRVHVIRPIPPPPPLSSVVAVAVGFTHSVALKSDGTVVAWGGNNLGQCDVPEGLDRVVAIAAGSYHTVALRDDTTVVVWGGQGLHRVPPNLRGVTAIAAGGNRTLALLGSPETPFLTVTPTEDGLAAIWPVTAQTFSLESSRSLSGPEWRPVTSPIQRSGRWNQVLISPTHETLFFQLSQP